MKALFVSADKFNAMQARAEKAEGVVASIKEVFGTEADAEDFDVVAAIKSLGTATEEVKPNAALAALATKYNVQPESNDDAAVIKALDERMETYAGVTIPPVAPKSKEEKIETDPKAEYPMTPFEASVREAAEKEAAFDKPVLD
jgi:hypothetical protein